MNYTGIVRGFGDYTATQREQLQRDLSLSFSDKLLCFCMAHYKNAEKRDPYIDELQMLSALSEVLGRDCAAITVSELFTNDEFVAKTYADMLQKRKVLNPSATSSVSLREIASIPSRYLYSVTGRRPRFEHLRSPEYVRDLPVSPSARCAAPAHSPFRLRFGGEEEGVNDDLLVLLSRAAGDTIYKFARRCERFFDAEDVASLLTGVYPVGSDGLLRELLEITDGLSIDLRAFSPLDSALPVTVLTSSYTGCRIVRVSRKNLSAILDLIKKNGIEGFPFAQFTKDSKFTFVRQSGNSFSVQSNFLCTLFEKKELSAMLPNEKGVKADGVFHRATNVRSCAYLSSDSVTSSQTVSVGGITCAAASACPQGAFFESAIVATVASALSMALCGRDHTEISLCSASEMPDTLNDPHILGECLSLLLGAYRAQTELSLVATHSTIRASHVAHPSLSVFAYGNASAPPARLSLEGSTVYCLAVPRDENGLPDFPSLRELQRELAACARNGHIASARVLVNESVTEGLSAMQGLLSPRLTDTAIASESALPLAVLIESNESLPYRPVAKTVTAAREALKDPVIIPPCRNLLWAGSPVITVLAQGYDSDAAALSAILSHRGAEVKFLTPAEKNVLPLAHAILLSQILILCDDAELPNDARISAALDFFKKCGGSVLSFSEDEKQGVVRLKNGISETLLDSFFLNK